MQVNRGEAAISRLCRIGYHILITMGYRNESDALRGRVVELEEELVAARETIDRLEGRGTTGATREQPAGWFTGAPKRLELTRELPFEIGDEGFEAIAALLRTRMDARGHVLTTPAPAGSRTDRGPRAPMPNLR
jgi:hypothetical protein